MNAVLAHVGGSHWTPDSVEHGLVLWGRFRAMVEDGKSGYPDAASYLADASSAGYRSVAPGEFTPAEFAAIDRAVAALEPPLAVVVACYYKPGHLPPAQRPQAKAGGKRCASIRVIAGFLAVTKWEVEERLRRARTRMLQLLSC